MEKKVVSAEEYLRDFKLRGDRRVMFVLCITEFNFIVKYQLSAQVVLEKYLLKSKN